VSYVFEILFALATLALPELGWTSGRVHPWGVLALVLVPYALGWVARRALLGGRFRIGALLERLLAASPVLLQAVALAELGWTTTLERRGYAGLNLEEWLDLELLAALLPYFMYQLAAIDARARSLVFTPDTPSKLRRFQLRLFLSALLPFLVYLAGSSLIGRSPTWKVRFEEVGLLGGCMAVLLVGVFLWGMPFFLRVAWDTSPIERGWARTMLEQVARSAGFQYRELLVWNTGQQMANAAIVGFSARSRHVFFSDLLLQQLGPRELAAVFAHEMGHARRAHAAVFGAFALGFFLAAQQIVDHFEVESPLWGGVILVGVVGLWYLGFGYLSRRFELEADLESLRVVGESSALVRALELVTGAHAHQRTSWRHFSTRDRVAFLKAAETDPLVGIRLKMRLARWRKLGFALFAVAALLEVRDLARAWDEDWLVSDLRLGRFEEAAERASSDRVSPEYAALARRAATVPPAARDKKALGGAALAAWGRGDLRGAQEWLELARLRGARRLEPLIEALEGEGEGLERLPAAWNEALRSLSER
jgi:Zn-dependent protease with chaperone function